MRANVPRGPTCSKYFQVSVPYDGLLDRCLKLMADAHGSDDGLIWEVYQDVLKKLRCVEYRLRSRTVCLTASDAVTTA